MNFLQAISGNFGSPVRSSGGTVSPNITSAVMPSENPFATNSKLFVEPTVGVNPNIKRGDPMFIAAQAGRDAGVGHSYGIA